MGIQNEYIFRLEERVVALENVTMSLTRGFLLQEETTGCIKTMLCWTVYISLELLNQTHLQKYPRLQKIVTYVSLVPLCLGFHYALK
jgi:hypothetical protein